MSRFPEILRMSVKRFHSHTGEKLSTAIQLPSIITLSGIAPTLIHNNGMETVQVSLRHVNMSLKRSDTILELRGKCRSLVRAADADLPTPLLQYTPAQQSPPTTSTSHELWKEVTYVRNLVLNMMTQRKPHLARTARAQYAFSLRRWPPTRLYLSSYP